MTEGGHRTGQSTKGCSRHPCHRRSESVPTTRSSPGSQQEPSRKGAVHPSLGRRTSERMSHLLRVTKPTCGTRTGPCSDSGVKEEKGAPFLVALSCSLPYSSCTLPRAVVSKCKKEQSPPSGVQAPETPNKSPLPQDTLLPSWSPKAEAAATGTKPSAGSRDGPGPSWEPYSGSRHQRERASRQHA